MSHIRSKRKRNGNKIKKTEVRISKVFYLHVLQNVHCCTLKIGKETKNYLFLNEKVSKLSKMTPKSVHTDDLTKKSTSSARNVMLPKSLDCFRQITALIKSLLKNWDLYPPIALDSTRWIACIVLIFRARTFKANALTENVVLAKELWQYFLSLEINPLTENFATFCLI